MPLGGTFSNSLLALPVWTTLEPVLKASNARLEGQSQAFDFSFHLAPSPPLHVLLLTPSSLEVHNKQETFSRLESLSSSISSTTVKYAIAFLLSEDSFTKASGKCNLDGILALQTLIVESLSVFIPILPVPDVSGFLSCIEEYMRSFVHFPLPSSPTVADSMSLLPHAATSIPPQALSDHDTNNLSDWFPSLQTLSQRAGSEEGQAVIQDYLADEVAMGVGKFWDRDWGYE